MSKVHGGWSDVTHSSNRRNNVTYLILPLKPVQTVLGLKLELGADETLLRELEEPGEQGVIGGWLPIAQVSVQPDVQGLDQGLAVLLATDAPVQGVVSREQQLEDLTRAGERPVRCQEDVYVGGFQFAVVVRQALDQPLHRAGLQEAHPHRLPFQMRDLVVRILANRNGRITRVIQLLAWGRKHAVTLGFL